VILKKLTNHHIKEFKDFLETLRRKKFKHERKDFIIQPALGSIPLLFQAEGLPEEIANNWAELSHEEFFSVLLKAVPDEKQSTASTEINMKDRLREIKFYYNCEETNIKHVMNYFDKFNKVREQFAHIELSEEEERQLVKEVLYKTIGDEKFFIQSR
jgi:hypothetical protein